MFLLFYLIFSLYAAAFGIYVPRGNLSEKPLASLGIKTIGWQDSSGGSLKIHQNYSSVKLQQHSDAKNLEHVYENNRNRDEGQHLETDFDQFEKQSEDFGGGNGGFVQTSVVGQKTQDFDQVNDNQFVASSHRVYKQTQDFGQKPEDFSQHTSTNNFGQHYPRPEKYTETHQITTTTTSTQNNRTPKQYNQCKGAHCDFAHKPQNYYSGNRYQSTVQMDTRVYSKCPPGETGQFIYELSCNQFLNCYKGRGHAQNCAPGTLFNPKTLECDFADKVQCVTSLKNLRLDLGPISEKIQASCPKGFTGIIPHYKDCSKFINCANGVEHLMDCAPGTLFNVRTNICDYPYKAECVNGENGKIYMSNLNQNKQESHSRTTTGQSGQNSQTDENSGHWNRGLNSSQNQWSGQYSQPGQTTGNQNQGGQSHTITGQSGQYSQTGQNTGRWNQGFNSGQNQWSGQYSQTGQNSGLWNPDLNSGQKQWNGQYSQSGQTSGNQNQNGQSKQYDKTISGQQHGHWSSNSTSQTDQFGQSSTVDQVRGGSRVNGQHVNGFYVHTGGQQNRGQSSQFHSSHGIGQNRTQKSEKISQNQRPTCPTGYSGPHPHPYDCKKFLNCANGATFIQDCGPGTVFNPVSKVCDFPHNTKCANQDGQGSAVSEYSASQTSYGTHSGQNWNNQGGHRTNWNAQQSGQHTNYEGSNAQSGQYGYHHHHQSGHAGGFNQNTDNSGQYHHDHHHHQSAHAGGFNQNADNQGQYNHHQSGHAGGFNQNRDNRGQYHHTHQSGHSGGFNQNADNQGQYSHHQSGHAGGFHQNTDNQGFNQNHGWNQNRQNRTYSQHGQNQPNYNQKGQGQQNYDQQGQGSSWITPNTTPNYAWIGQTHNPYPSTTTRNTTWVVTNNNYPSNSTRNSTWNFQSNNTHPSTTSTHNTNPSTSTKTKPKLIPNQDESQTIQTTNTIYDQNVETHLVSRDNIEQLTNRPPNWLLNKPQKMPGAEENFDQQSASKGKQWPPPFPSTDLNADYVFELDDLDVMLEPDFVTSNTEYTTHNTKKNWCDAKGFECGNKVCIAPSAVCNGRKDCPNGKDEIDCEQPLAQFSSTKQTKLAVREVEKITNVTLKWCAKNCFEQTRLNCKAFNYRKYDGTCFLLNTNVDMTGALIILPNYDYYENKAYRVDCSQGYLCRNKKCISRSQICDGSNDCSDWGDEKGCSAEKFGYGIKLGGSNQKNSGRIEVEAFGKTGYICDDMFGLRNADVACRELGFPLGALEVKGNSVFAADIVENNTFYMMDDVSCLGNETTLRDCDFGGWGVHNCRPQEIVGVVCKTPLEACPLDHWQCKSGKECLQTAFVCDGVYDCADSSDEDSNLCESPIEIRIVNGTSKMEGRVEIKYHGIWGTVCDDDFNDEAAKVVCNQLGFRGAGVVKKSGYYGPGIGPIWLDQVFCHGNETKLANCVHWDWGENNCDHNEDVGVVCSQNEIEGKPRNIDLEEDALPETETLPTQCGFRNDSIFLEESDVHFRVVKGSVAKPGEYPWQASIRVKGKTKSSHWCGAVVISKRYVLTAAHCLVGFSKGAYTVVAGDYNVDEVEGTEQEAYIEDFQVHEEFRHGNKMNNDIALIKLKGSGFKFTDAVQPICLPAASFNNEQHTNCTISGFGSIESGKARASHFLRAGWIPVQSREICKMPHIYGDAITTGMFCAGSLDEGVDACDGDSGGPLACLHDGVFTLFGLTSWGQHCGYANKPGVYVKVAHYRNWIENTMKKMQ